MAWDFIANTRAELLEKIEGCCLVGKVAPKVAAERISIVRLLQGLARADRLQYPACMLHTSRAVPDFQLRLGGVDIGAEVTRIPFPNVEAAHALQGRQRDWSLECDQLEYAGREESEDP